MESNAPLLPIPENLDVYEGLSQLTISFKWFKPVYYFTLLFSIVWCGFLLFWYSMAFGALFSGENEGIWIMLLFPLLHVAVGVYLAYYTLCGFLNKTFIEVNSHSLTVRYEPLPWFGARHLMRASVKQLYTIQHVQSSKNGRTITYRVQAITTENKSITLVRDLDTAQHAQFIERKIEQYLGIENQAVEGEYQGGVEQVKRWFW